MSKQVIRSGRYIAQPTGYRAFVPEPLPPNPPVRMDDEMNRLVEEAGTALGRLDGVASVLPNPDLFVGMYVKHEAVLSSEIEGTQATLEDVLDYESEGRRTDQPEDVEEVINYVRAMNFGLRRLPEFPLSLRLIREIHEELLRGVRGQERSPGEFRTSQNWIGPGGCTLADADFVPPPPHEMQAALDDFQKFLHDRDRLPKLIHCGLAHAQFETIHPFLDGNGRVGRLLITLLLVEQGILSRPLLYLSYYLKAHRAQYYDRLTAVRTDGDWEGWLKFFLRGILEVSTAATNTARDIVMLRDRLQQTIRGSTNAGYGFALLDHFFEQPILSIKQAEQRLGCVYKTAARLMEEFEAAQIVREITGQKRNKRYRFEPYVALFKNQILPLPREDIEQARTTETDDPPRLAE